MLGLLAAQLKYKIENNDLTRGKAVWVDVSGFRNPPVFCSDIGETDWRRNWVSFLVQSNLLDN